MVKLYPGTLEAVLKGLFTRAFLALNHHAAGMRWHLNVSADEDQGMWLKAPETASKWASS